MRVLATERDFKATTEDPICQTPLAGGGVCDAPKHHHMNGTGPCTITDCRAFTFPSADDLAKLPKPSDLGAAGAGVVVVNNTAPNVVEQ